MLAHIFRKSLHHVRWVQLTVITWILLFSTCPPSHALSVEEEILMDNNNIYAVYNDPTAPTTFNIAAPYSISYIETYHWNSRQGKTPGTIRLRHSDGTVYGPWSAQGREGQGGTPNAYWSVEPFETIKAGTYTVEVSDPASWSFNSLSDNQGFAIVKGFWAGTFGIASFSQLGATIDNFRFFEADGTVPPQDQIAFDTTFSKDIARYIYYQLDLSYLQRSQSESYTLTARYIKPDGSIMGEFDHDINLQQGWTRSWHSYGWGWATAGNWEEGTYTVKLFDGTAEITQGTFTIGDEPSSDLDPSKWLNKFSINISESTVDEFMPAPDFNADPPGMRRSIDPFGLGMDWFQSSRIQTGRGGIRIFDVNLNNDLYWIDMRINPSLPVTLDFVDMQPGYPSTGFPHWEFGNDFIDFRLTKSDVFGPPPYFSMFDVGVGGSVYDLDFTLSGSEFILSDVRSSGYVHFFPNDLSPQLAVITDTQTPPAMTDTGSICFSDLPVGAPIALFNVPGPDGEDYLSVNYCNQIVNQKFSIHDGIALGTYGPPQNAARTLSLETEEDQGTFLFLNWFSRPSRDEQLTQCIKDQTTLTIGLQRDNQLGNALFELATSLAGELKLANKTLNAAKDTLLDSKDVITDVMATGKVDSAKLSEFVLKTLLKNATPEEHEELVKKFFDDKVPDNVKTLAEGSGTAMEEQYKTALLGIIKSGVKTYFPRSSALAETIVEAQKWAIEAMADEDIRILYRQFKENSGGDWDFFSQTWNVSRFRANKQIKIKQLLEKQGKSSTDTAVAAYMKNLFEGWYSQEKEFPAKLAKLEDLKTRYDDDYFLGRELENLMPNATECERLLKLLEWFNNAQLDILESMGKCTGSTRPGSDSIRDTAFDMISLRISGTGTSADRRAEYQKRKLEFLKLWDCLDYEEPARSETCDDVVKEGANNAEVLTVELGKTSGSFEISYETYTAQDRVIVAYENRVLHDSGCVGTNGWKTVTLSYSGSSSKITVRVEPNCAGTSNTLWKFKVTCPQ